jgi:hypothetical protein
MWVDVSICQLDGPCVGTVDDDRSVNGGSLKRAAETLSAIA